MKKVQRTVLLIGFVVVLAPLNSSAQETHFSRVLGKVRNLLSFSATETAEDQKVDQGRRKFLALMGATAAVMAADPTHVVQALTGTANTGGMASHEIYSLFKMRSMVPAETLSRLAWASKFGLPAGTFNTVDLVRIARFRMSAATFTEYATTSAGRAFGAQLVSSSDVIINAAFADATAALRAPRVVVNNQTQTANQQKGAATQAAQTTESIVGPLTLSELLPSDLYRRLQWAEKFQTRVSLDHQETLRFLFYTAATSVASESAVVSEEERSIYKSMSNFAQSMLSRIQTEAEARKMLRGGVSIEQLEAEPSLEAIRHTLHKVGRGGLFAPACHAIYKIRLQNQ